MWNARQECWDCFLGQQSEPTGYKSFFTADLTNHNTVPHHNRVSVLCICSFSALLIHACVQGNVDLLYMLYDLCICTYGYQGGEVTVSGTWILLQVVDLKLYGIIKLTEKVALKEKSEAVIPLKLLPTIKITQQSASALASFSHDLKQGLTVTRILWAAGGTPLLSLLILGAHKPRTKRRFLV